MAYKYSYEGFNKETMGRASSTNQHISLKKTVETANAVKGKKVETAILGGGDIGFPLLFSSAVMMETNLFYGFWRKSRKKPLNKRGSHPRRFSIRSHTLS